MPKTPNPSNPTDAPGAPPLQYQPLQGTEAPPSTNALNKPSLDKPPSNQNLPSAEPLAQTTQNKEQASSSKNPIKTKLSKLSSEELLTQAAKLDQAKDDPSKEVKQIANTQAPPAQTSPPSSTLSQNSSTALSQASPYTKPNFDTPSPSTPTQKLAPSPSQTPSPTKEKTPSPTPTRNSPISPQPTPATKPPSLPTSREADPRQNKLPTQRQERHYPIPEKSRRPVPPAFDKALAIKRRVLATLLHGFALGNIFLLAHFFFPIGLVLTYLLWKIIQFSSRGLKEHFGKSVNFQLNWIIALIIVAIIFSKGFFWYLLFLAGFGVIIRNSIRAFEGKQVSYPRLVQFISERE